MDRRQKKSRDAIFCAFTRLLSKKNYNNISVSEIIDEANVGRTTFYAHFETKDFLLKELCENLFNHIIDSAIGLDGGNYQYECKCRSAGVFVHLFYHLKENDGNVLELLSSQNNDIFLRYFKTNLKKLIEMRYDTKKISKDLNLPEDYIINHISSSHVETVCWWINEGTKESPEQITEYFLNALPRLFE
jgi:AcrR family transcriptional regulator